MPFRITPENRILYPQDKQKYTLHAEPLPVIWQAATVSGTILADQSVRFTTGGSALVAPVIYSGAAALRLTITADSLPENTGGPGYLEITLGNARFLKVRILETNYQIFTEGGIQDSVIHPITIGDQFYLEIAGNRTLLLVNGLLESPFCEYITDTPISYPVYASIQVVSPFQTSTKIIKAPELMGDWRLDPAGVSNLDWTLGGGGTLDVDEDVADVNFTAGDTPGGFNISAQIVSSVQTARTQIRIPPLNVVGPRELTLNPGDKVTFRTNYDNAQNQIVDWSVVGGGSLNAAHEYTAPIPPGLYEVHAKYKLTQDEKISVTIPPVISVDTLPPVKIVRAVEIGSQVDFMTNIVDPDWSASAGVIGAASGIWIAPNIPRQISKITAEGAQEVSIFVIALEVFPYQASYVIPVTADKTVITARAEDGTLFSRQKSKRGRYRNTYRLTFRNRTIAQLNAVLAFWERHYPGGPFIFKDELKAINVPGFFTGPIEYEYNNGVAQYSFTFEEKIDF